MSTVTALDNGSGNVISSRQTLVGKVCALKGFSQSDPNLVERAEQFLDDTIRDLNTLPWDSTKDIDTYTLVQDQMYVTLNTDFYKASLVYLTDNTFGDTVGMTELPYVTFKRMFPRTNTDLHNHGVPSFYATFNYEKDRRLYFETAPDADTVSRYRLTVEFYKRLPLITSVAGDTHPDIPDYFENAILHGAYKRVCAHLSDADGMKIYSALERESIETIQRIDTMQPNADTRILLVDAPYVGRTNTRFYGFSPF